MYCAATFASKKWARSTNLMNRNGRLGETSCFITINVSLVGGFGWSAFQLQLARLPPSNRNPIHKNIIVRHSSQLNDQLFFGPSAPFPIFFCFIHNNSLKQIWFPSWFMNCIKPIIFQFKFHTTHLHRTGVANWLPEKASYPAHNLDDFFSKNKFFYLKHKKFKLLNLLCQL